MKYIATLGMVLLFVGCASTQAPITEGKHRNKDLSDNKVDVFTLMRIEPHYDTVVNIYDNEGSKLPDLNLQRK